MSEKLTVAELLARNKRNGSSDDSRPRRRRSLADGGVSVSELTGSIPVVKDEHLKKADANKADAHKAHAEQAKAASSNSNSTVASKPAAKPEAKEEPKKGSSKDKAEAKPEAKAENKNSGFNTSGFNVTGFNDTAGKKDSKSVATDAAKPERKIVDPHMPKKADKPADKPEQAKQASSKQTSRKQTESQSAAKTADKNAVASDGAKRASNEQGNAAVPEEFEQLEATLSDNEVVDYEDDRISVGAMLLQALGATVGGVLMFLLFNFLWNNVNTIVVLALALVVTVALVIGVHLLLRHKDKLLMLLALIVGLVLTVGPRLLIGV